MARKCKLTGKGPLAGHNISHAHNKTNRVQLPNLQWKRVFVPELDRTVRIRMTTRAIRTIDKKGLMAFLKDEGLTLRDVL
jgi:large subunit ribosomal protein L28